MKKRPEFGMKRFKYPAPFDPPDPGPITPLGAPIPPGAPGPPLPIEIPNVPQRKRRTSTMYGNLFGEDLSVVADAMDADWATPEQHRLVRELLDGRKSVVGLDNVDRELLDDLAHRYIGAWHAPVRQADSKGLHLPNRLEGQGERDQRVQLAEGPKVQPGDPSDFAGAYGWLRND